MKRLIFVGTIALGLLVGCGNDDEATTPGTEVAGPGGGKFDTPAGKLSPEEFCHMRRADALDGANRFFTEEYVKWPCKDVDGVNTKNKDDRGQEYCEYFAVVKLPEEVSDGRAVTLGQNIKTGGDDWDLDVTALALSLTEDQSFYLEDHGDEIVGQCIFTSWHQDTDGPLPVCGDDDANCPSHYGVPLDAANFQMKVPFNSNSAAAALVNDCIATSERPEIVPDADDLDDPLWDDFFRGCMLAHHTYQTEWRSSDTAVCAAAMRLKECGCSLPDNADVGKSLVPPQPVEDADGNERVTLRGFPLGTWSAADALPVGCRYVDIGEATQAIVSCDLTGTDLLKRPEDPKETCREKYGNNVVIHVPVPGHLVTCNPPEGGMHAGSCSATPWLVSKPVEVEEGETTGETTEGGTTEGETTGETTEGATTEGETTGETTEGGTTEGETTGETPEGGTTEGETTGAGTTEGETTGETTDGGTTDGGTTDGGTGE